MPRDLSSDMRLTALVLMGLMLGACAHHTSSESPALKAVSPTVPASEVATASSDEPQTQGIATQAPLTQSLPPNPSPDSYAYRDDARRLARQFADQLSMDQDWTWNALSRARFKESVTRYIMPPPPGAAKNWTAYRGRFVEPIRIRAGVQFWREHRETLRKAEQEFGVPASVIVGVLGVETIYGRQMGNFRALDALATLSLDFPRGRSDRSDFFKDELGQLLKWCQETGTDPALVMASYAGAIGMPQFMPSSLRRYAVDYDQDGRIDLLRSPADAIGSVANFLAHQGWQVGVPGYFDITPPTEPANLRRLLEPDIVPSFTAAELINAGASLPVQAQTQEGKLALVALQNGENRQVYVAGTANFYAVTRYNQSSYYALAVLQLGETVQREAEKISTSQK